MFTYHCTVLHGLNGESWSLVGNAQAGSFTFLTFNFVLWRIFSRSQCSNTHTKVNTGRQFLAECVEKKLGAPRVFPFFSCFPSSSSLTFFGPGFWACSVELNVIQKRQSFGLWADLSAFTFTVWHTAAPRLFAAIVKSYVLQKAISRRDFLNKSLDHLNNF